MSDAIRPQGDDALTIGFSDPAARLHGVARLGVSDQGASGLLLLFRDGDVAAVAADGGVALPERPATWQEVSVAGLDVSAGSLQWAGDAGALDLALEPLGATAEVRDGTEQALRVTGTATLGATRLTIDGLGQRGRSWAAPDWERTELARTVHVWLGDGRAVALSALRPSGRAPDEEQVEAVILDHGPEPVVTRVTDPRLSTTYDSAGRQRHAGLELWVGEDGPVHRIAGEAVAGTTLDLGRLRLDAAFFTWRGGGLDGVGRYDVLRRVG